jgi:imidazolonepropionase-like amidohydrolase
MSAISPESIVNSEFDAAACERLMTGARERRVWLRVGQLVDGESSRPIRDASVVFDADVIHFVGGDGELPKPDELANGRKTPDAVLPNATLLPTLIEAHAHLFLDGAPIEAAEREAYLQRSSNSLLERARARWGKILACGVGAVRDAGDKHGVGLTLATESKAQQVGRRTTPYLDSPGAAIHHRGRYGSFMGEPIEEHASAADCVAERLAAGADRIKLLVSGIINFKAGRVTAPPQMPADEVAAIVGAARSAACQTFAHASGADGIENAIEGGVDTVEHGFFVTRDQLARMRDRQVGWVPTFAPVALQLVQADELGHSREVAGHLERILAEHGAMLCHAAQFGVPIIAGSDAGSCGVPHGLGLHDELVHMERAGLAPMSVLRSATGTSGRRLHIPEAIGRVAPGYRSRMILTVHDPLSTVENLRREKLVLFDGLAIHCPAQLDSTGL